MVRGRWGVDCEGGVEGEAMDGAMDADSSRAGVVGSGSKGGAGHPNGVDHDVGCGPRAHGRQEVGGGALGPMGVEAALGEIVGREVYRAGGDHAEEHGAEPLPKSEHTLIERDSAGNGQNSTMR